MLSFIKKSILARKQNLIKRRYPDVNITLHPDMPLSSVNSMVKAAAIVDAVNKLEPKIKNLSDGDLRRKTEEFSGRIFKESKRYEPEIKEFQLRLLSVAIPQEKERIKERLKSACNKIFTDVLIEAFAVVRETGLRTIGMRHFDVQIAGGVVLHEGGIAEMTTGEGKTLVATLPAYLNALLKKGVHIVTVNDYLARRDAEWMGPIYEFLGLSVGVIQHDMPDEQRKAAYGCDITYGTNNEFGFDYLRDNMKYSLDTLVQRPFFYAIVDEVDSILIDEARTPLIISGAAEDSTEKYYIAQKISRGLNGRRITERDEIDAKYKGDDLSKGFDYIADEKNKTVALTEAGEVKATRAFGVDDLHSMETVEYRHHAIAALRAKEHFARDVDYVVRDGQVIIVDEFTGRLMPGRRWSDGLHQAIEAKEGLRIGRENQTLATITFQNYFRMYEKLAGMTGTAFSEAQEFKAIYQLDVVVIPTNRKLIRTKYPDCVYKTEKEKFDAVAEEIIKLHNLNRPVLVGTTSVGKNLKLSQLLKKRGIPHEVLNAKDHKQEARIIAEAGREGKVTVATNMAGRGIDIVLGGNPGELKKAVLATIICQDSLGYVSDIISEFKPIEEKIHELIKEISGVQWLHKWVYRRFINKQAGRIKDYLINFDMDYSSFHNSLLSNVAKLKEAIAQEQKYSEEIFLITGVDADDLKDINGFLENSSSSLQNLEFLLQTKQNIKRFMESLEKGKRQIEDVVKQIVEQEDGIRAELEIIAGLDKEKKEFAQVERVQGEEFSNLVKRLTDVEEKFDRIEQESKSPEALLANLTEYTREFKELKIIIEESGKEFFDSKKNDLQTIKTKLLEAWRPVAYYKRLAGVKQKIDNLEGIVGNQLKKEISAVREQANQGVLENIRKSQREFDEIEQNLHNVNLLSREKIGLRDLSTIEIKNTSLLSAGSRAKIGILSEDIEIYSKEHEKIVGLGGLHVLGTERHESRRIDNQLRGRSGRQGDPGSSRFYVSLEDDLMRLFGSDRLIGIMDRLGLEEGQVIEHPWVSKSIEIAQRRVEGHNFEIRKQLLEYDNVMNKQREVIYIQRRQILDGGSDNEILQMLRVVAENSCRNYLSKEGTGSYDLSGLLNALYLKFGVRINKEGLSDLSSEQIQDKIYEALSRVYTEKQEAIGTQAMQHFERMVLLQIIDSKWKDHLFAMDDLREGIGLRAIGQRDPLIEYKREAFLMFDQLLANIQEDVIEMLFKIQPAMTEEIKGVFRASGQEFVHPEVSRFQKSQQQLSAKREFDFTPSSTGAASGERTYPKVGRNDPCPCGAVDSKTGKPIKYKKCHGR